MNGMTIMIAGGGAVNDRRASLLANEASKVAGRCLYIVKYVFLNG